MRMLESNKIYVLTDFIDQTPFFIDGFKPLKSFYGEKQ